MDQLITTETKRQAFEHTSTFSFHVHICTIICMWAFLFVFNSRSLSVTITSVVPGDYDGDSQMDVLLTTQAQNHGKDELSVFIFWGHNQTLGELLKLLINKIVTLFNTSKYCQKVITHYSVVIAFATKIGMSSYSAS